MGRFGVPFFMLTVYAIPVSLYCAKLRILLRHKNLKWREQLPPGGYGSEEYKLIVPSGNLPALVEGNLIIADSEAIAEYLNEKHPLPPMLPRGSARRAKVRERSRFHDTRLEPALRKLFPHLQKGKRDTAVNDQQSTKLTALLEQFGRLLSVGDKQALNLDDCGFAVTFIWIDLLTSELDLKISWPQAVLDYRRKLDDFAAVAEELSEYRPRLVDYVDSL